VLAVGCALASLALGEVEAVAVAAARDSKSLCAGRLQEAPTSARQVTASGRIVRFQCWAMNPVAAQICPVFRAGVIKKPDWDISQPTSKPVTTQ
jgi:hypothetical protein